MPFRRAGHRRGPVDLSDALQDPGDQTGTRERIIRENGAQGRSRTADTAIFSRMLYQLSYLGERRGRWDPAAGAAV